MPEPWRLTMFGGLTAERGDLRVEHFRTQKTALLLAYLACYMGRKHAREELVDRFWPDVEIEPGRMSLRSALSAIRRALEPSEVGPGAVLIADRMHVRLDSAAVETDVADFEGALRASRQASGDLDRVTHLTRACGLYRGPFLPGIYDDWALAERERLELAHFAALGDLADALDRLGDRDRAVEAARQAVAADPLNEASHLRLMRVLSAAGQTGAALRHYDVLARTLREELSQEPSPEARALRARIESQQPARAQAEQPAQPRVTDDARKVGAASQSRRRDVPLAAGARQPAPRRGQARIPAPASRFFGREAELAEIELLLLGEGCRQITLIGAGGSGKTRLSLAAARSLAAAFHDAVWFVDLADVPDAVGVAAAIAGALGLARSPDVEPVDQIGQFLAHQPSVLVLDCFEHLLDEGAPLVRELLVRAPDLRCVVTSRQRLDLPGERLVRVGPLPVPHASVPPDEVTSCPSVRMFEDRARSALPGFQITGANADAVAAVCARLEGIPLALELAAAWIGTLTPAQILARLERRFELLSGAPGSTSSRHHSLRMAIDASFHRLSPDSQEFMARLTVFRGGWDLDAAERVCGEPNAAYFLRRLTACSLVVSEDTGERLRFRVLDTVREYAAERLSEADEHGTRMRHVGHYADLAERGRIGLHGPEQGRWLSAMAGEQENVRAALTYALEHDDSLGDGLRLAGAMSEFWEALGSSAETWPLFERLLPSTASAPPEVRARFLLGAAIVLGCLGHVGKVRDLLEESERLVRDLPGCEALRAEALLRLHSAYYGLRLPDRAEQAAASALELAHEAGDPRLAAAAMNELANLAREGGKDERAAALYREGIAILRDQGDHLRLGSILADYGYLLIGTGEFDRAISLFEETLAVFRGIDHRPGMVHSLWHLGRACELRGDLPRARQCLVEAVAIGRESGPKNALANAVGHLGLVAELQGAYAEAIEHFNDCRTVRLETDNAAGVAVALGDMGRAAAKLGEAARAHEYLRECLRASAEAGARRTAARALEWIGCLAGRQGCHDRQVRLFGAAAAWRQSLGYEHTPGESAFWTDELSPARRLLGDEEFQRLWSEGAALPPEGAIAEAIAEPAREDRADGLP